MKIAVEVTAVRRAVAASAMGLGNEKAGAGNKAKSLAARVSRASP